MVKVQGQSSNRNTVKETDENGQKVLGDEDAAGITSLVPRGQESEAAKCLEFDRA